MYNPGRSKSEKSSQEPVSGPLTLQRKGTVAK
jgi:hypothetical protein